MVIGTPAIAGSSTILKIEPFSGDTTIIIQSDTIRQNKTVIEAIYSPLQRSLIESGDITRILAKYGLKAQKQCYERIIWCESRWLNECNREYGCRSGMGLMQLIPARVEECSIALGRKIDPMNPIDNLECGAYLLKKDGTRHWGCKDCDWGSYDCWIDYCK